MRAAVIANPAAGRQTAQETILRRLCEKWHDAELFGVSGFGGEYLPQTLPAPGSERYLDRFSEAMAALTAQEPGLLITVGGDGTAAYAAEYLLSHGNSLPILGIGAGTANVGPIVTEHDPDALPAPDGLRTVSVGAVEALSPDGRHIAYGFNDLVLGNTLLGSVSGETVTLDAYTMASSGEKRICGCLESVAGDAFSVEKNGFPLPTSFPKVGQIIASTVERESYYGRAVAGILCYTPDSPCQAAICLTSVPIITCGENPEGFTDWLTCGQLLMEPKDTVAIRGLADGVCAVADGNPYLLPENSVLLRYVPELLQIMVRR